MTTNHKPATALPIHRHFDCMKKCPMDCKVACKRAAYPELVAALQRLLHPMADDSDIENAQALIVKLGEA